MYHNHNTDIENQRLEHFRVIRLPRRYGARYKIRIMIITIEQDAKVLQALGQSKRYTLVKVTQKCNDKKRF